MLEFVPVSEALGAQRPIQVVGDTLFSAADTEAFCGGLFGFCFGRASSRSLGLGYLTWRC